MKTPTTDSKQIFIYDTTLRDGQQCPGAGMSFADNIRFAELIAQALQGQGIIEAGFPASSKEEFARVHEISKQFWASPTSNIIAGLCQLREEQIVRTLESLELGISHGKSRLHTVVSVDPVLLHANMHIDHKDFVKKKEIVERTFRLIQLAKKSGAQVQFSLEGYATQKRDGKDNSQFTTDLIQTALEAGADVINIPDTIGVANQWKDGEDYFVNIVNKHIKQFAAYDQVIWSTHNHNDIGQATTNTMNAIINSPVSQVEVTINGVGERAGNASLQEIVIIIDQLQKKNGIYTHFDLSLLQMLSDFVAEHMLPRQPNAVLGKNAFVDSSGIHASATSNDGNAYRGLQPEKYGGISKTVFGPSSGGGQLIPVVTQFGYTLSKENNEHATFAQFLKDFYTGRYKWISEEEIMVGYAAFRRQQFKESNGSREIMEAEKISYTKQNGSATVTLTGNFFGQQEITHTTTGDNSPLYTVQSAIDKHMPGYHLVDEQSHSGEEGGIEALSLTSIQIKSPTGNVYTGQGKDQDIEKSAIKALIDAYVTAYVLEEFVL